MARPKHEASAETAAHLTLEGDRPGSEQIRPALLTLVRSARAGMLLPSERVLAERFAVARMTVRGCLEDLESQGLVERIPGRGTFVREPRVSHSEVFRSFSQDMRLRGMEPGSAEMSVRRRAASQQIADGLDIAAGEQVFHIERVRTADGIPMALERTNLESARFPGLDKELDATASLYDVLGARYGVRLESAQQRVSIARLTQPEAERLMTSTDLAAFLIERRALDNMGKVVEFGRSLYRGDRYEILMHVTKRSP